jgi:patched domain-containing protein
LTKFGVQFLAKIGRFGRVIITSKDEGNNLLKTSVWKELRQLDDIIQNTTVEYDGETFSYHEICAMWEGECFTNDILNLDYILPEVTMNAMIYF